MGRLRVLVVEDSVTTRMRLVEALGADGGIDVVGQAGDGKAALELCRELRPDVVTVDMVLPVMSGLAATEYIMAYCPTPILIVSASANRGTVLRTFDALQAGAVDVLEKPTGEEDRAAWDARLVAAVKMVSRIKVITHPRRRMEEAPAPAAWPQAAARPGPTAPASGGYRLVAIGASTGGPGAVRCILRGLPRDFPLPLLLVLHVDRPFGPGLVEWLAGESPLPVAAVRDGEVLPPVGEGRVCVAPADFHLTVSHGRLRLSQGPERHSCRPSVDVLFESVAAALGPHAVGCLLTGMGKDGAAGLLAMRHTGGMTLAQDEATSVVYGMPREAVLLGAASRVLPVGELAGALRTLARAAPEGHVG